MSFDTEKTGYTALGTSLLEAPSIDFHAHISDVHLHSPTKRVMLR